MLFRSRHLKRSQIDFRGIHVVCIGIHTKSRQNAILWVTPRLFHHHAEMQSVGGVGYPTQSEGQGGGRWWVDLVFRVFLKPYIEDPFPTHQI